MALDISRTHVGRRLPILPMDITSQLHFLSPAPQYEHFCLLNSGLAFLVCRRPPRFRQASRVKAWDDTGRCPGPRNYYPWQATVTLLPLWLKVVQKKKETFTSYKDLEWLRVLGSGWTWLISSGVLLFELGTRIYPTTLPSQHPLWWKQRWRFTRLEGRTASEHQNCMRFVLLNRMSKEPWYTPQCQLIFLDSQTNEYCLYRPYETDTAWYYTHGAWTLILTTLPIQLDWPIGDLMSVRIHGWTGLSTWRWTGVICKLLECMWCDEGIRRLNLFFVPLAMKNIPGNYWWTLNKVLPPGFIKNFNAGARGFSTW